MGQVGPFNVKLGLTWMMDKATFKWSREGRRVSHNDPLPLKTSHNLKKVPSFMLSMLGIQHQTPKEYLYSFAGSYGLEGGMLRSTGTNPSARDYMHLRAIQKSINIVKDPEGSQWSGAIVMGVTNRDPTYRGHLKEDT
ncbi:hypothetical protein COCNU_02G017360 [Cocos nucifera]|uniref:Uncharacterized protein n=1 Tax=Cocos nucifera TaxID=13894 RepID=A0A8K0I1J0_COCNU|nr:hypothetical protein COCNU_02G017360 [Cocos nucifera]